MKKFLSFALLLTILFTGCKKDNPTTTNNTHKVAISALGFGDVITYTITSSYIAKGSTEAIVLEKKDIVGSLNTYTFNTNLHTGDTLLLELKSNSNVEVYYSVYDGSRQVADKRTGNLATTGAFNFRYVVPD